MRYWETSQRFRPAAQVVAQGGYHGLGNTRFKSSTNRAPRQTTPGTEGESRSLQLELIDVLAQDVGVLGVFSDWPATTTYYASCMGLK